MEPKFQTSFIPKSPIISSDFTPVNRVVEISIIGTLSTIVFVVSVLIVGGLFGYTKILQKQIAGSEVKLSELKSIFESDESQDIIDTSNQLKSIKSLLQSHVVVSPLFELFEKQVLPTVRLNSFNFIKDGDGLNSVVIEGEGTNYLALAQQARIFSNNELFKNVEFSNLALSDSGTVKVKIKLMVDSDVVMYSKKIQALSLVDSNNSNI